MATKLKQTRKNDPVLFFEWRGDHWICHGRAWTFDTDRQRYVPDGLESRGVDNDRMVGFMLSQLYKTKFVFREGEVEAHGMRWVSEAQICKLPLYVECCDSDERTNADPTRN
jgi:hypothetical protein